MNRYRITQTAYTVVLGTCLLGTCLLSAGCGRVSSARIQADLSNQLYVEGAYEVVPEEEEVLQARQMTFSVNVPQSNSKVEIDAPVQAEDLTAYCVYAGYIMQMSDETMKELCDQLFGEGHYEVLLPPGVVDGLSLEAGRFYYPVSEEESRTLVQGELDGDKWLLENTLVMSEGEPLYQTGITIVNAMNPEAKDFATEPVAGNPQELAESQELALAKSYVEKLGVTGYEPVYHSNAKLSSDGGTAVIYDFVPMVDDMPHAFMDNGIIYAENQDEPVLQKQIQVMVRDGQLILMQINDIGKVGGPINFSPQIISVDEAGDYLTDYINTAYEGDGQDIKINEVRLEYITVADKGEKAEITPAWIFYNEQATQGYARKAEFAVDAVDGTVFQFASRH